MEKSSFGNAFETKSHQILVGQLSDYPFFFKFCRTRKVYWMNTVDGIHLIGPLSQSPNYCYFRET
jgi:hypothetical protein